MNTKYCGSSPGNKTNLGAGQAGGLPATSAGSSVCCRNKKGLKLDIWSQKITVLLMYTAIGYNITYQAFFINVDEGLVHSTLG